MNISEFEAPGFDDFIKGQLLTWGFTSLTEIQQIALNAGVAEGTSLVVSAPTSSGKTLVGELAALTALRENKRCLYLVSHKALADQKYIDFERRFGEPTSLMATIGLRTGDRDEGEVSPRLLVATYEKALALILSGQVNLERTVVVADELQIVSEPGRGPNIEALCSVIRQQGVDQFIALTATVGNPQDIAEWLGCELALGYSRDVDLYQEIWSEGKSYSVKFGQDLGEELKLSDPVPSDCLSVVNRLLANGRGPVLVFTESRREAQDFAENFSASGMQRPEGILLAEQLDLFSEPTEASEQLLGNARKGVAFHTADLTAQERNVVEDGFTNSKFDVCFATSTLAAGVNFPFRSVVFPKLTYEWGDRAGTQISRSDYRNMSGRAGRLGMHENGFSILLPKNRLELQYANDVILPSNELVNSQLASISMRKTVLMLVTSKLVDSPDKIKIFFENTFFWHQIRDRNPSKLNGIISTALESIDWLEDSNLIEIKSGYLVPTQLGKAVSESGLLPSTALSFLDTMQQHSQFIEESFEDSIAGLIHWMCSCDEFRGETATRFLVYPVGRRHVASDDFLYSSKLFAPLNRTDTQLNQCAHAMVLFCNGLEERKIRFQTNIPSGAVHRLSSEVAWVIEGLQRIASVPSLGYSQQLTNNLSLLARRVNWGTPAEALDLIRVAQRGNVPGFGRQRALAVIQNGLTTFEDILSASKDVLIGVLRNEVRVTSLLNALSNSIDFNINRFERVQLEVAETLGMKEIVKSCNADLGTEYEVSIKRLLEAEPRLSVTVLDDGKVQNVPDLLLILGGKSVLLECKTTTKTPPLINKSDAWAVLQKAADYDPAMDRVTLGKPGFDAHSKKKVAGASDISLVEHAVFMEGMLRVLSGSISIEEFMDWISTPGLVEVERLGGSKTYEIARG